MKIVLFSADAYFTSVFSPYVKQHSPELTISFYTNRDKALNYIATHEDEIDVLIASEGFLRTANTGIQIQIVMGSKTAVNEESQYQYLNIYQKGMDIIDDLKKLIISLTGDSGNSGIVGGKLFAFTSTQGGSGKTTLAYMTAVLAAQRMKTAYINMESGGFVEHLYPNVCNTSMGDILFAVKDRKNLAAVFLEGLKSNADQVFVLPPFESNSDLEDMTGEDFDFLIHGMMDKAGIECIIVDMPYDSAERNQKILQLCNRIFMVYSADAVGKGKQRVFANDPANELKSEMQKISYVQNRCPQKVEDPNYVAMFPVSQSLAKGVAISSALANNREFANGCGLILEKVLG